ncbi:hypothetical protein [Flavobacterium sp.]|jgi:hypothetical protein|uniref:hypothetical protein n=1 Tax=Flavobacterium sp. TaxID=239 RepID=UPI002A805513|nr:hypothetical protein [Flavobacterium sp.]
MSYSVSNITLSADCDVLLTSAGKEKADLEFKKLSEERLTNRYATTSVEVDAVLQGVLVELSAVDTIISVLPDGPTKDDEIKKKVKLEYKKFLLENRKESYGAVALLEKQMDLARVVRELDEVNAFITIITDHKATL